MENKTEYLIYGLTRNSQEPLDPRNKINSLATINTELPLIYRYKGLIFFVISENKHFLFLDDLVNPISLQSFLNTNQNYSLTSSNYTTLLNSLNSLNASIGQTITVLPLGVTFIYKGSNIWKYYLGEYNFLTITEYNNLPNSLKEVNKYVKINNILYIINSLLQLTSEIIVENDFPTILENNRYYKIKDLLYICLNQQLYKIGEKFYFQENFIINNNNTLIEHNLNSTYISGLFWININNYVEEINKIIPLSIKIIDENNSEIISNLNLSGNLLLTANF